jgi:3',5'-cyclic AMP phosphodiesterase CpdA
MTRRIDRRSFLGAASKVSAAAILTPELILSDPYAPWARLRKSARPVRVRGRVTSDGRGLAGVRISDGVDVVRSDADGRFDLVTTHDRGFVACSTPAGHRFDRNVTGTARFYRPIMPDANDEMAVAFDLERLRHSDANHSALIMPDPQTQNAWEMQQMHEQTVPDVQATVRASSNAEIFGVACGDIMYDDLALYPEYERAVQRMGVPFFQVVGNHDLDFDGVTDEATTRTFSRHFGPRYYSFDRGSVRYVILDDVFYHGTGYIGYLQQDQLRWLEQDLADLEDGSPVVVALHIPAFGTRHVRADSGRPGATVSVNNREALYRLLEPFTAHVVSGHTHENDHNYDHGVHEHVSGTVCGAWWSGPICADGTPNGYSVYEVQGEDIRWRYKGTGLPADHQMRAYLPGADPRAPQELAANVWDADDGWTVVWYEDGERRGTMARRVGFDPVSVGIHQGEDAPPRRTWVEPYPRYLYYAPISPSAREVRVDATDRFGRTYSALAGPVPPDMVAWPAG